MPHHLLGIDIGGSVIKAAVFDLSGELLAQASHRSVVVADAPGHAERDPGVMWESAVNAVRRVLESDRVNAEAIAAIGVTGFGNGLFLVDSQGNPTRAGIGSIDTRAASIVARWRALGWEEACWNQALQPFWSGQPLPLLEWVKTHEPDALKRAHRLLSSKDILRSRLTGTLTTERTDLGSGGLYDPMAARPAYELFEAVGLPQVSELIPEEAVVRSEDIAGTLTPEAAEALGLSVGIPVVAGVTDNLAVLIGSGVTDSTRVSVIGGTWGINQTLSPAHVTDRSIFQSIPTHLDDFHLLVESTPNSMSNYDWYVRSLLALPDGADEAALYAMCDEVYERAHRSLTGNLIFMPHLYGSPRHPNRTAALLGLTGDTSAEQMLAAVYEAVAFEHRTLVDRLPISESDAPVRVSGGILRSSVWLQLYADALNRPIETPDTEEVGARGIAMVAAVGVGLVPTFTGASEQMTRVSAVKYPQGEKVEALARRYALYSDARELTADFLNR